MKSVGGLKWEGSMDQQQSLVGTVERIVFINGATG
jgi:hypothetical protein